MSVVPTHYTFQAFQDQRTGAFQVVNPLTGADYTHPPLDGGQEPTTFRVPTAEHAGWRWAPWGKEDRLPSTIRRKVDRVPMAGQTLYRLMGMMYGNGLAYYRNEDLRDGPRVQRAYEPVIEQWLRRCRLPHQWVLPQFLGYRYHFNAYSQLIFNRRRDQVTGIYHLDGEFSRKSVQDEQTLRSEYLYYSAEFSSEYSQDLSKGFAIPFLDWHNAEEWVAGMQGYKAAWHSHLRTPGTIYYATPPWVGLFRDQGWLDNAAAVPEIVHAMQRNQIMLKYQIMIPMSYFQARYRDWNSYDAKKQERLMDELTTYIETELTDTKNAYKSITTFFGADSSGREIGKITIEAIDDKIKRDSWVPTSNTADAQIVQGLGMHPSQLGLAPEGGKMGAGSGSDQREAFNTMINLNTLEQEIVLEPLNWAAQFNARVDPRWDVTFYIDHTHHTTTNQQESGLQPSAATILPE
jgi:hypothetical protein